MAAQLTLTNGPDANGLLPVDVRRQQFLAGARLAGQQHARVGARHLRRLLERRAGRPGSTRSSGARRRPVRAAARSPAASAACSSAFFSDEQHPVAAERLLEEVERARARGRHRVGDGRVPGDHDDRRVRALLRDERQQVDAVAVRQAHVEQIRVGVRAGQPPPEVGAAPADGDARSPRPRAPAGARRRCSPRRRRSRSSSRSRVSSFCRREDQPEPGAAQPPLDERRGRRRPAARSCGRWPGPAPCRAS